MRSRLVPQAEAAASVAEASRWELRWKRTRPFARLAGKVGFFTEVRGRENLPHGPYVLASNHLSHVDPPFVGMAVGDPVRFMSASDLVGLNRFLDWVLPFYGAIPLPRSGVPLAAMKEAMAHIQGGGRLCLFPEGRRTAHWGETAPLTGAAWLALRCNVPVVPLAISGTDRVMSLEANLPRPAKVVLSIGQPLAPEGDRHELTDRWHKAISDLLA